MRILKRIFLGSAFLLLFLLVAVEAIAQRRTYHSNARYNTRRNNVFNGFPPHEITVNAGNVFVSETQITYGRAITPEQQLTFSAGVIYPTWIKDYFNTLIGGPNESNPFYSTYCHGFSLAVGYSRQINDNLYLNFQVFYRYMFYNNEAMYLCASPNMSKNDYLDTVEDLQRHVIGGKLLLVYPIAVSSSFRCNLFAGIGARYKFDFRHFDYLSPIANPYYNYDEIKKKFSYVETFSPSVHLGFQIGFGW